MSTQQIVPLRSSPDTRPLLSVDLSRDGDVAVITICGELDMGTAGMLTELVQHVAREHPERVVLDMAKVSFFCADGLRALMRARDAVATAGGQLVLRAPSARTRRVLTITGTDHLFPLDDAVAAARDPAA
jgi:anti-anti-sigma factor